VRQATVSNDVKLWNPKTDEATTLEDVTRGLIKIYQTEKTAIELELPSL
jgi:hypothetical protein